MWFGGLCSEGEKGKKTFLSFFLFVWWIICLNISFYLSGELAARVLGPDPTVLLCSGHSPLGPGVPRLPLAGGPGLRVLGLHGRGVKVRVRRCVPRTFLCFQGKILLGPVPLYFVLQSIHGIRGRGRVNVGKIHIYWKFMFCLKIVYNQPYHIHPPPLTRDPLMTTWPEHTLLENVNNVNFTRINRLNLRLHDLLYGYKNDQKQIALAIKGGGIYL